MFLTTQALVDEFLGSRFLDKDVEEFLEENKEEIIGQVYRGLPYPWQLIKPGQVIEEWYGSSHWTFDKKVAEGFSVDYINESFSEEMQEEYKLSEDEIFVPLVLILDDCPHGVKMYNHTTTFKDEKEVTLRKYDFIIEEVLEEPEKSKKNIKDKPFTIAKVTAVSSENNNS